MEGCSRPRSLGHLVHFEIALGRNSESVRDPVEESKHGRDVDRFGNLRICPAVITQDLYVLRHGTVSRLSHFGDVLEQYSVWVVQPGLFEVSRDQCLHRLFFCSLNPQEVSVRVQSIGTAIEPGDPAGDGFFGPPAEVPFRKMDRVAEAHDIAQEIRAMAEAFENARHLLAARVRAPFVVYLRNLTSGVSILNYFDLRLRVCHG